MHRGAHGTKSAGHSPVAMLASAGNSPMMSPVRGRVSNVEISDSVSDTGGVAPSSKPSAAKNLRDRVAESRNSSRPSSSLKGQAAGRSYSQSPQMGRPAAEDITDSELSESGDDRRDMAAKKVPPKGVATKAAQGEPRTFMSRDTGWEHEDEFSPAYRQNNMSRAGNRAVARAQQSAANMTHAPDNSASESDRDDFSRGGSRSAAQSVVNRARASATAASQGQESDDDVLSGAEDAAFRRPGMGKLDKIVPVDRAKHRLPSQEAAGADRKGNLSHLQAPLHTSSTPSKASLDEKSGTRRDRHGIPPLSEPDRDDGRPKQARNEHGKLKSIPQVGGAVLTPLGGNAAKLTGTPAPDQVSV